MTKTRLVLLTTASVMACGAAFAQDRSSADSGAPSAGNGTVTAVGELVVTANKREQRALDVPMGVSAIAGADLQRNQILDLGDLVGKVPGLSLNQGGTGPYGQRLVLRGLNTGNSGATVAQVVDDVPFSLSGTVSQSADLATDFDTYDLQRIEVLRGPQGTLYGATAEGGLIKYVTNPPDPNGFHAGVEGDISGLAHASDPGGGAKGYINIPLFNGTAALRATGFYEHSPGYVNDALAGLKDTNNYDRYGGRFSFLWKPNPDLSIRLSAFLQTKSADNPDAVTVNGYTNPAHPFDLANGYNFDTYLLQPYRSVNDFFGLNIQYDLHWARVQSITSYGYLHYTSSDDNPYYVDIFRLFFGISNPPTLTQFTEQGTKKYTEEFRIVSEPGSSLFGHGFDWQAGFFFDLEDAYGLSHYVTRNFPSGTLSTAVDPKSSEVFYTNLPSTYKEYAGYADFTYHFSRVFDVEAGGRVFNSSESNTTTEGGALFGFPITNYPKIGQSETSGTFSVAPRWHLTPNDLIYVRIASGFRPGGPEPIVPGVSGLPAQFGSDRTVNYEIGFKGALFDNRVTLELTGFYIDWTDIQVTSIFPLNGAGYPITANVGSASSKGVEWAIDWRPIRHLTLGAAGSYTRATLGADLPGTLANPVSGQPGFIPGHAGDVLPYVPDWNSTVSVNYDWPVLSSAEAYVGASWTHVGEQYTNFSFTEGENHAKLPAYDTFDAHAGVRMGHYGVEIYGKNLSDERGFTSYNAGQLLFGLVPFPGSAYFIRPREVGLRVTADF